MLSRFRRFTQPRQLAALSRLYSTVRVTFIEKDGNKKQVDAKIGETILNVANENGIELEGSCEGSLACSTCHVYLDEATFKKIGQMEVEEEDMLDSAQTPVIEGRSRLGCQVQFTKEMEGAEITIPSSE